MKKDRKRKKLKDSKSVVSTRKGKEHNKDDKLDLGCSYFDIQCSSTKEVVTRMERMTGSDRRCQLCGRRIDMQRMQ